MCVIVAPLGTLRRAAHVPTTTSEIVKRPFVHLDLEAEARLKKAARWRLCREIEVKVAVHRARERAIERRRSYELGGEETARCQAFRDDHRHDHFGVGLWPDVDRESVSSGLAFR
jgi:hypothetical protein